MRMTRRKEKIWKMKSWLKRVLINKIQSDRVLFQAKRLLDLDPEIMLAKKELEQEMALVVELLHLLKSWRKNWEMLSMR